MGGEQELSIEQGLSVSSGILFQEEAAFKLGILPHGIRYRLGDWVQGRLDAAEGSLRSTVPPQKEAKN